MYFIFSGRQYPPKRQDTEECIYHKVSKVEVGGCGGEGEGRGEGWALNFKMSMCRLLMDFYELNKQPLA